MWREVDFTLFFSFFFLSGLIFFFLFGEEGLDFESVEPALWFEGNSVFLWGGKGGSIEGDGGLFMLFLRGWGFLFFFFFSCDEFS